MLMWCDWTKPREGHHWRRLWPFVDPLLCPATLQRHRLYPCNTFLWKQPTLSIFQLPARRSARNRLLAVASTTTEVYPKTAYNDDPLLYQPPVILPPPSLARRSRLPLHDKAVDEMLQDLAGQGEGGDARKGLDVDDGRRGAAEELRWSSAERRARCKTEDQLTLAT